MSEKIRLNKFISESGACSRREADRYIEQGHVFVNGRRANIGVMVDKHDKVLLNGALIEPKNNDELFIMAFNKPVGVVSTTEKGVKNSIVDYIGFHERIFPVGRLDKDSQGLIFLTNNGDIVNKILRAGNNHEKEYVVQVDKPITPEFIQGMANGVPILGSMTKKCKVSQVSTFVFSIVLVQGMNRQIRRMSEYFKYEVQKLERIRIMDINLKGIGIGEWRMLNDDELRVMNNQIAKSSAEPLQQPKVGVKQQQFKPTTSNKSEFKARKPKPAAKVNRGDNPNPKSKDNRGGAAKKNTKNRNARR